MANEAGLETVLSAAYSLKHETDMMKTFTSLEEAYDKAKAMGLTPDQAAKHNALKHPEVVLLSMTQLEERLMMIGKRRIFDP